MRLTIIALALVLAGCLSAPALAQNSDKNLGGGAAAETEAPAAGTTTTILIDDSPWPGVAEVKAYFLAAYGPRRCDWLFQTQDFATYQPEVWDLTYHYDYETDSDPGHRVTLYRFGGCIAGAYNIGDVYLIVRDWDGIQPVFFSEPELSFDEQGEFQSETGIVGYLTSDILINSDFDPETRTISSFSKWRGLGDASSGGQWTLIEDRFVLKFYEVDTTYDEKTNPVTLVDWPPSN